MKKLLLKYISMLISAVLLLTATHFAAFAEADGDGGDLSEFTEPIISESNFYLPGNMRAVIIYPKNEHIADDGVFDSITELGLNTIIIATSDGENVFYNTDTNITDQPDYITEALNSAKSRGLNVYLIFDINTVLYDLPDDDSQLPINALITKLHLFTLKYPCDGIILDNYYTDKSSDSFERYMRYGSGIGYTNWLFGSTDNYFKTASDIVHLTDNSVPVGIMLNDMWDNSASGTDTGFDAYNDGYADTKSFITDGYADFAMVRAKGALTDSATETLPFDKVTEWWDAVCSLSNTPMYIIHHNENLGGQSAGWSGEDQLLRQLTFAEEDIKLYKGSVFNSYSALLDNPLGTTDSLLKFFDDSINKESLFEDLTMTAPKSLSYSTNDSIAIFQGTYDDNFDVYFNDTKVSLNEAGNFYIERELKVGMNYFTIKHKGKEIKYSIERKVIALYEIDSSIGNGKTLNLEGGTRLSISAVAYKGAEVTATVNGQTIKLKQQDAGIDDPELRVSYALFTGKYTIPDGIVDQTQSLGTIKVTANYQGYTRYIEGASVNVNALPAPAVQAPVESKMLDQDSAGSGEVVGYIDPIRGDGEEVTYVRLSEDNTVIFSAKTTGSEFDPDISRLPAGTVDYYKSTAGNYYTTESGKRVSTDGAVLEKGYGMGENSLTVVSGGTSNGKSYFRIDMASKASYNIKAAGMSYYTAWGDDYNVSEFTAKYIYIDFDNVTSVTKLPSFKYNSVFSSGKWETVEIDGIPKFRLVLELRQAGVYAGNYSEYNTDGHLVISFPVLTNSLAGMTVVIDPGHGYGISETTFDPGAIGHVTEQEINLAIAKKLKTRLEEAGATAVRLQTEKDFILTKLRPDYARMSNCDLFISLHCNSAAGNSGARGQEVWYFTPFSQPLADSISSSVAEYFKKNVYSDGANMNRGAKHSYYWVTTAQDFPSVLVELGFVTNYEDAMALASGKHQNGIADAIVSGIKKYLSRSNVSQSTDGSESIAG